MKRIAILATCLLASILVSHAQGTVNFFNVGAGVNAPIFNSDGVTKLAGAQFMAELLAGPIGGSLAPVGAATTFLTGANAGYFAGGVVSVPGVAGGSPAQFQVRAWDTTVGATYAAVLAAGRGYGSSTIFQTATGGAGSPPSSPTALVGLTSFSLVVPEPSTIALGIIGGLALLLRRRK